MNGSDDNDDDAAEAEEDKWPLVSAAGWPLSLPFPLPFVVEEDEINRSGYSKAHFKITLSPILADIRCDVAFVNEGTEKK